MNPKIAALQNLKTHLAGRRKAALGAKAKPPPVKPSAPPVDPGAGPGASDDELEEALAAKPK